MDNIQVRKLTAVSFELIHESFREAFSDYEEPFTLSLKELIYMLQRRGFDANLSFGAFHNNKLVSFILNGVGEWNGKNTIYDTGTGTIKDYRKKGIASRIFNESLPILQANNITQYLLEVIKTNTKAIDLYKKADFSATREFDYYVTPKKEVKARDYHNETDYQIVEIGNPDWDFFKTFWDFQPSWQNSIESINRKKEYFYCLGLYNKQELIGYGIIERHTGDIPQLAVIKKYRVKEVASLLFERLIRQCNSDMIKIINAETNYLPFSQFADSLDLKKGFGQYEMILNL